MTQLQRVILGPRDRERDYGIRAASSELDPTDRSVLVNFLLKTRASEPPQHRARAFFPLQGKNSTWCAAQIEVGAIGRDVIVVVDAILLPVNVLESIGWATHRVFANWPPSAAEDARVVAPVAAPLAHTSQSTSAGRDLAMLLPYTLKVDRDVDLIGAIDTIIGEIPDFMRPRQSYCSSAEIPPAFSEGTFDLVLVQAVANGDETRYTRRGLHISQQDRRSAQNIAVELDLALSQRLRKTPSAKLSRDLAPALRQVLQRHRGDVRFADLLDIITAVSPRDAAQRDLLANAVDDEFEATLPRSGKEAAYAIERYCELRPRLGEMATPFVLRMAMETGALFLMSPDRQRPLFSILLESKDFSARAPKLLQRREIAGIDPVIELAVGAASQLRSGRDDLGPLILEAINAVAENTATEPASVQHLVQPMEILIECGWARDLAAGVDAWVATMHATIPSHTKNCLRAAATALNRHMRGGSLGPRMPGPKGDLLELHLALFAAARHIRETSLVR